jgi:AcrR family transcriptional regulator
MPAVPGYQRARSPAHKEERREAILAAARALANERSVREVSLGDIARQVGLAKSNVLRYFDTREEVFLQLVLREWMAWLADATARLERARPAPGPVAEALAASVAVRPLFCDLLGQVASVLEHNVSGEVARAYKARSIELVDELGRAVTARVPGLAPADGRETIAAVCVIVAGLWPMANPPAHVREMFASDPALVRAHVDLEPRLVRLLTALITGFLAQSG